MAYWGGRGRGQGGFGGPPPRKSKQEPFVLFPDTDLPNATQVLQKKINDEELLLIKESLEWLKKSEYYHLEQIDHKVDNSFEQYLVRSMFPSELMTRGSKVRKFSRGQVAWDRKKEESYWDRIEKIEQDREKKQPDDDEDKENDDGDEEEDDENDEDPDMNDYIYDTKVDDDEDAYNDEDEGIDEPEL